MRVDLRYLVQDVDRHGNVRRYVRKTIDGKVRKKRLRQPPGTPAFMSEYEAALSSLNAGEKEVEPTDPTTLGWLIREYEQSHAFKRLTDADRRNRHLIFESCLEEPPSPGSPLKLRDCPLSKFDSDFVRMLRDRKADKPAGANNRVKFLGIAFGWACEERSKVVKSNPTLTVKKLGVDSEGFYTWTREDVLKFEQHFPIGSKPRLALALMLYLGVRRSDARVLGHANVNGETITFTPHKTRRTSGKTLELPILKPLREVLDTTQTGLSAFVESRRGQPYHEVAFGNWFSLCCREAGLPHCSAHGLRKAGATFAAENGATVSQLMAMFGWEAAQMAVHYVKQASQKKLAADGMPLMLPFGLAE